VYQHLEYFAFGETFVEEHSNTWRTPYLFNGKELDDETGLYYYGARYYDAQTSVWVSSDPLANLFPNKSTYSYCFNNPIMFNDPNGMAPEDKDNPNTSTRGGNGQQYKSGRAANGRNKNMGNNNNSSMYNQMGYYGSMQASIGGLRDIGNSFEEIQTGDNILSGKIDAIITNHRSIMTQKRGSGAICSDNYINQCAIRVSKAIVDAGVDFSDYPSHNICSHGHARDAGTLWHWVVKHSNASRTRIYSLENDVDYSKFKSENAGRKGIVYFEDNGHAYHIDTFDGSNMTDDATNFYSGPGMKIYFREIK
jgi:RHS repeat-associated protein